MLGRTCLAAVVLSVTLGACTSDGDGEMAAPIQEVVAAPDAGQPDAAPPAPVTNTSMIGSLANLGDSISQGYDADDTQAIDLDMAMSNANAVFHDNPQYSWVQGTDGRIGSVADHYKSLNRQLTLTPISHSGAELVGLVPDRPNFQQQAELLVAKDVHPDLVYVLLGGNDVCNRPRAEKGDPTASLYSVEAWKDAIDKGLTVLANGLDAGATVRFVSMPRVDLLYEQVGDASVAIKYQFMSLNVSCKQFWSLTEKTGNGVCPIVTTEPDAARRAKIGERIDAYNDTLAAEVRRIANDPARNPKGIHFQSDWHGNADHGGAKNGSMGTFVFDATLVSKRDCFHPSIEGQRKVAEMALSIARWE